MIRGVVAFNPEYGVWGWRVHVGDEIRRGGAAGTWGNAYGACLRAVTEAREIEQVAKVRAEMRGAWGPRRIT